MNDQDDNQYWGAKVEQHLYQALGFLEHNPSANVRPYLWEKLRAYMPQPEPVAWMAHYLGKGGKQMVYTSSNYELAVENDTNGNPIPLCVLGTYGEKINQGMMNDGSLPESFSQHLGQALITRVEDIVDIFIKQNIVYSVGLEGKTVKIEAVEDDHNWKINVYESNDLARVEQDITYSIQGILQCCCDSDIYPLKVFLTSTISDSLGEF